MWKGHPAIYYGGGAGHWEISRWKKKKCYLEAAIFKTKVTWSKCASRRPPRSSPWPLPERPADLPKSSGLRLRVRMK